MLGILEIMVSAIEVEEARMRQPIGNLSRQHNREGAAKFAPCRIATSTANFSKASQFIAAEAAEGGEGRNCLPTFHLKEVS